MGLNMQKKIVRGCEVCIWIPRVSNLLPTGWGSVRATSVSSQVAIYAFCLGRLLAASCEFANRDPRRAVSSGGALIFVSGDMWEAYLDMGSFNIFSFILSSCIAMGSWAWVTVSAFVISFKMVCMI
jgi:hypothetical protein